MDCPYGESEMAQQIWADVKYVANMVISLREGLSEWTLFLTEEVLKTECRQLKDKTKLSNDIKWKTSRLEEGLKGLTENHQGFIQWYLNEQEQSSKEDTYSTRYIYSSVTEEEPDGSVVSEKVDIQAQNLRNKPRNTL